MVASCITAPIASSGCPTPTTQQLTCQYSHPPMPYSRVRGKISNKKKILSFSWHLCFTFSQQKRQYGTSACKGGYGRGWWWQGRWRRTQAHASLHLHVHSDHHQPVSGVTASERRYTHQETVFVGNLLNSYETLNYNFRMSAQHVFQTISIWMILAEHIDRL